MRTGSASSATVRIISNFLVLVKPLFTGPYFGAIMVNMTHTERRTEIEEWDEEVCDACGHAVNFHYDEPVTVAPGEPHEYIAVGCMVLTTPGDPKGRRFVNNPYLRCPCEHSK